MYLIVGLGNPGTKYELTRHNVGFRVLDLLAPESDKWETKHTAHFLKLDDVILLKPQTFMNDSGEAVKEVLKFYPDAKLIVVHDELDFPLGTIKLMKNISAAGHNGIKSIIEHVGTQDFIRIRVGINNPILRQNIPGDVFVLQKFTDDEQNLLKEVLEKAKAAVEMIQTDGLDAAQTKFNG